MRRLALHASTVVLLLAGAAPARAACDPDGVQASGAIYRICMPEPGSWNGRLVIWAHGYVAFNEPVAIPEDQLTLPDGTSLPDLINALGFGFATTSYSVNGLAVRQGLADVVDLVGVFTAAQAAPTKVYLVGASEGGLITTLGVERHPEVFAGGVAACGPIGSFPFQVNYFGDFRVVFDTFFPGLLPGDATSVPPELIDNWDAYYELVVKPTIFAPANLGRTLELIGVTRVPFDAADFWSTAERSIRDALWYAVFATNDAVGKLGGQPFDNARRYYSGSSNDLLLNLLVRRHCADPAALAEMRTHYDTRGSLARPLVTLHTLLDQQVSFWHEWLYLGKAWRGGSLDDLVIVPVNRYGHCNFTALEALVAFGVMLVKAEGAPLSGLEAVIPDAGVRGELERAVRERSESAR